jgi:hypothetical protein
MIGYLTEESFLQNITAQQRWIWEMLTRYPYKTSSVTKRYQSQNVTSHKNVASHKTSPVPKLHLKKRYQLQNVTAVI